jgi:hypothetical protein
MQRLGEKFLICLRDYSRIAFDRRKLVSFCLFCYLSVDSEAYALHDLPYCQHMYSLS